MCKLCLWHSRFFPFTDVKVNQLTECVCLCLSAHVWDEWVPVSEPVLLITVLPEPGQSWTYLVWFAKLTDCNENIVIRLHSSIHLKLWRELRFTQINFQVSLAFNILLCIFYEFFNFLICLLLINFIFERY